MIRIALTGPESSGKTTLGQLLAKHFNAPFIAEHAREYLEHTGGKYTKDDLSKIARGHLKGILSTEQSAARTSLSIVDTDFIVLEIWSEYKYNTVDTEIENLIRSDMFDLHILCQPDIPWESDEQRENPNDRDELFTLYEEALNNYQKHYIVVNGSSEERMKKAIEAIELL